jgi:tetratricopeptide (TPR) repeat protein
MATVHSREAELQHVAEEATLQETWSKGQAHLQLKEYAQAIAVFSGMLNTSYADRAQSEINAAANLAAQEDRQKAAELFVQAGSAKDQSARVALLFQSRQLLQNILNKYPQSDLVEKVRKNLERIESDLKAIDPALLTMPSAQSPEQGSGGQPVPSVQSGNSMNGGELQVQPAANGLFTAQPSADVPQETRNQE